MMKAEIQGLDALARQFEAAPKKVKSAAEERGTSGAEQVAAEMRERVSVHRGALRDSIRTEPAEGGGTLIRAGGTPETVKEIKGGGEFDEALSVEFATVHSSPKPFFYPSLEAHRESIENGMGEAADDAAGKAVR